MANFKPQSLSERMAAKLPAGEIWHVPVRISRPVETPLIKRMVAKVGNRLMVALPATWCVSKGIRKGSEVRLKELDGELIINGKNQKE